MPNAQCWSYSPGATCEGAGGKYCGSEGSGLQPAVPPPSGWDAVLRRHNVYRCMHGVPLLSWSTRLQQQAQAWADHTQGAMYHGGHDGAGQNLATMWPRSYFDDVRGVQMWYEEIKLTSNGLVNSFGHLTGHYTQVVWRGTAQIGCAHYLRNTCDGSSNPCLLVCHYFPPGNVGGLFQTNVNAPLKSQATCEHELNR